MEWGFKQRNNDQKTGKKCRTKNSVRRVLPDAPNALKSGNFRTGSGVRGKPTLKA